MLTTLLAPLLAQVTPLNLTILMALEASFFPLPSELVVIPAGYLVARGQLDLVTVLIASHVGIFLGTSLNYAIGRFLGRGFIQRYGRYLLIREHTYERTEHLFLRNAIVFSFLSRFIPGVRHLIAIPAGMFRMRYDVFLLCTHLGSGIWVGVLLALGYFFGAHQDVALSYAGRFGIGMAGAACVGIGGYVAVRWYRRQLL